MVMWGVEEDDTKGRARLPSTVRFQEATCVFVLFGFSRSSFAKFKE